MKDRIFKISIGIIIFSIFFVGMNEYFNKKFTENNKAEIDEIYKFLTDVKSKNEIVMYLIGKFDPAKKDGFSLVPDKYTTQPSKMYLRTEVLKSFIKMNKEAEEDGVYIKIASATRNFVYQKNIWKNKWRGATLVDGKNLSQEIPDGKKRFEKILEYGAAPGTSRHHWGTDIDINGITPGYFYTKEGKASYDWLVKNAPRFGFCQPYNEKNSRVNGYNEERWHWSYIPTARIFMEEYKKLVKEEDISGFLGDRYVKDLDLINNYVLSINPECL